MIKRRVNASNLGHRTFIEVYKNGPREVVVVGWEVDILKPKVWREGFQYHFNKKLLYMVKQKAENFPGVS